MILRLCCKPVAEVELEELIIPGLLYILCVYVYVCLHLCVQLCDITFRQLSCMKWQLHTTGRHDATFSESPFLPVYLKQDEWTCLVQNTLF